LNKVHCLDFGDLITPREIEDNLGIDTDIVPMFCGDMLMRDHIDINGVRAETIKILRAKVLNRDCRFPITHSVLRTRLLACLGFFAETEHCTGENAEEIQAL
jgi:hypothetical protein